MKLKTFWTYISIIFTMFGEKGRLKNVDELQVMDIERQIDWRILLLTDLSSLLTLMLINFENHAIRILLFQLSSSLRINSYWLIWKLVVPFSNFGRCSLNTKKSTSDHTYFVQQPRRYFLNFIATEIRTASSIYCAYWKIWVFLDSKISISSCKVDSYIELGNIW